MSHGCHALAKEAIKSSGVSLAEVYGPKKKRDLQLPIFFI
jgi:hypothetical protein